MTCESVITLVFAFFVFDFRILRVEAADCSTYISGSQLVVPENTNCDLSSDIDINEVQILGQVTSTSNSGINITITCTSFVIEAGAEVNLAGKGHQKGQGPGAGNAVGSGGMNYILLIIICDLLFVITITQICAHNYILL